MVFSSTIFLFAFLPAVLLGYYLLDRRFKNTFLLIASLFFYAWGEPYFVFVMILAILVNHIFAMLIDNCLIKAEQTSSQSSEHWFRRCAKVFLWLMVSFNLSLFFVYKYLNFTILNINKVADFLGIKMLPQTNIALPIGISFFTFQAMSYVFDVYRRRGEVQKNPLNTALYVSLFPQLIAGPIVRYETVAKEIRCRKETIADFVEGIKRFICGLAKKVILSNSLALLADRAFNTTEYAGLSAGLAWIGALSYTLQIYYDFSGYSDMAIGLGRMFGFHFEENFNYPYISKSISEFWRRWHISLGSWFRDYIYFPLGGSRVKTKSRLVLNLFVVWFLTGVWHGAAWNFIIWGLMYFVLIAFEKLSGIPNRFRNRWLHVLYRIFTLLFIIFGWIIFRADGLENALKYILCLFGLMGNSIIDSSVVFLLEQNLFLFAISIVFSVPIVPQIRKIINAHIKYDRINMLAAIGEAAVYLALFIIVIAFTITSTYNPFIYFNF